MTVGLPVTDAGTEYPACMESVSIIQAISCGPVPMSGAGMSRSGPMRMDSSVVKRRVNRSRSPLVSVLGSTITPPLAPPNGTPTTAAFHVMNMASARASASVMAG